MSNVRGHTSLYEILEVQPDAPQNEIHKAYQRAKQTYSQDNPALYSMFTKEEARELSRLIEEAYTVLGNQATRRQYDESLRHGKLTVSSSPMSPNPTTHEALPDFVIPEAGTIAYEQSETAVQPSNHQPQSQGVPNGMARTPLGTYKINEDMEQEIAAAEEFDGAFLQRIRHYKNIDLDKVSEYTRISRTYLNAVETDNYSVLPAPVFVRGFVVQVAKLLGLDENKVASSYMKRFKAAVEKS